MHIFQKFTCGLGYTSPFEFLADGQENLNYEYAYSDYVLDDSGKARVLDYINTQTLFIGDSGDLNHADFLIAFSFGDGKVVNQLLANLVEKIHVSVPTLPSCLQVEVASHVSNSTYVAIEDDFYQTTSDVAKKAKRLMQGSKVMVVAQAWHAKRCVATCKEIGLDVVAVRVVNKFSFNDPQPWVRNPINWVIKESHRGTGNGFDISEQYHLV